MKSEDGYIIISKDIAKYDFGTRKNDDINLLAYIKMCSGFKTGVSLIMNKTISDNLKIPIDTVSNMISRLKESDLVTVVDIPNGYKNKNKYIFDLKIKNYFFVSPLIFRTNIPNKIRGVLLLLKSLCVNNSNNIAYTKTKIAGMLKQHRGTFYKLIDECIELGLIRKQDKGYSLAANFFPLYSTDKSERKDYEALNSIEGFVYDAIIEHCNKKETIIFTPSVEQIKLIAAKYHQTEEYYGEGANDLYFPHVLATKFEKMPPIIESLNYFLKALNLEYQVKERSSSTIFL